MKRNLIIGAFTNYDYHVLKPWVLSINESITDDTDKVLIVGKTNQDTIDWLLNQNFKLVPMNDVGDVPIHVARFIHIYEYLRQHEDEYNLVLTTDVRDVFFQLNPFTWMQDHLAKHKLVVGSESIRYKHEVWGNENLQQTYGDYVYNQFKDKEIYNVGVFGGHIEYVKDLALQIAINSVNRPIPIVDQAVFNVLIQTQPWLNQVYFSNVADAFVCHSGTIVDADLMIPRFKDAVRSFKDFVLDPSPKMIDGKIYNEAQELIHIVHQYDRVEPWNTFVVDKYK
jgi:hypothetical protein